MSIDQIFQSFPRLNVLVVGDVMLDSYIWGQIDRISPEAPVPVVTVQKRDYRLGGAANVALNLSSLGARPVVCALVGDDEAAVKLRACLSKQSISAGGLVTSRGRPTTEKTRVIANKQHVVRVDEEVDVAPSAAEESMLMERVGQQLPGCDVVVFEDYDKGSLNEAIIRETVALANQKGIPTVVDPKKRNFHSYHDVTLFKPNLKELREGLKMDVNASTPGQVEKAVEMVKEQLNARGVMATLSEHGVYIDFQGKKLRLPAQVRKIADVSGAGDTVVAVAALCVALKLDPETIARYSNVAGGLVCQQVGVVPVSREELFRELEVRN